MITSATANGNVNFGGFSWREQALHAPKFKQIEQDHSKKNDKTPVRKKDRKKACAKNWDPYNAPPSTRRM